MVPDVVAFVGRSGAGKTTLIERLVPVLAARGVTVAVVKHSPLHEARTDAAGTDTDRFWIAGAEHVVLAGRDRIVHTHRYAKEPDLGEALAGVHGVDLVLVEGYKRTNAAKIEVIRRAHDPAPIHELVNRVAVVTDVEELDLGCPKFRLDDVTGLALFLTRRLSEEAVGGTLD